MIIKIFILIIFIAELIIAFTLIFSMVKLSKTLRFLDGQVSVFQAEIVVVLKSFRANLEGFVLNFQLLMAEFKKRQEEYVIEMVKSTLIYSTIFLARGQLKKMLLTYAVIQEIYKGFEESC